MNNAELLDYLEGVDPKLYPPEVTAALCKMGTELDAAREENRLLRERMERIRRHFENSAVGQLLNSFDRWDKEDKAALDAALKEKGGAK